MSSSVSTRARPIGARCRLYLITPPDLDARAAGAFAPRLAEALDAGDVACVQLRIKDADDDGLRRACDALRPVVQTRDVAFVLNDRPDLAAETGCDGVHVGQQDAPCREARAVVGDDAILGVSCADSYHLALEAGEAGADYVAFGAFFPTATKQATARALPDLLRRWQAFTTVPCVAIGGITEANCGALVAAGADFLAVASGVWEDPRGAARAVRGFDAAIAAAAG